jgi:hypothetical protein
MGSGGFLPCLEEKDGKITTNEFIGSTRKKD